jgi:hypothetical protein
MGIIILHCDDKTIFITKIESWATLEKTKAKPISKIRRKV